MGVNILLKRCDMEVEVGSIVLSKVIIWFVALWNVVKSNVDLCGDEGCIVSCSIEEECITSTSIDGLNVDLSKFVCCKLSWKDVVKLGVLYGVDSEPVSIDVSWIVSFTTLVVCAESDSVDVYWKSLCAVVINDDGILSSMSELIVCVDMLLSINRNKNKIIIWNWLLIIFLVGYLFTLRCGAMVLLLLSVNNTNSKFKVFYRDYITQM